MVRLAAQPLLALVEPIANHCPGPEALWIDAPERDGTKAYRYFLTHNAAVSYFCMYSVLSD